MVGPKQVWNMIRCLVAINTNLPNKRHDKSLKRLGPPLSSDVLQPLGEVLHRLESQLYCIGCRRFVLLVRQLLPCEV